MAGYPLKQRGNLIKPPYSVFIEYFANNFFVMSLAGKFSDIPEKRVKSKTIGFRKL